MPRATGKQLQETVERSSGAGADLDAIEPVSLDRMSGRGDMVLIGDRPFEVSPVPVLKLTAFGKILNQCPQMLTYHALAAARCGRFDPAETITLFRQLQALNEQAALGAAAVDGEDTVEVAVLDDDVIAQTVFAGLTLGTYSISLADAEKMVDLSLIVLRRRNPGIDREYLADELDVRSYLNMLATLFVVDPNLRDRFSEPAVATGA